MSLYIYAVLLLSCITLVSWFFIFDRYRNSSGLFYLIFSVLFPIWFVWYWFSYDSSLSAEFVSRVYRFQYSISIIWFYSILFFVLFFDLQWKKFYHYLKPIFIFFLSCFIISNATDLIVESVKFNTERGIYVENYGILFWMFAFLYLALIPSFIAAFVYKFKTSSQLQKTRIWIIIFWFISFIGLSLLSNVFIPFFSSDSSKFYGDIIFPFFVLPFIFSVLYSSYKYDFSSYKIYINNFLSYFLSFLLTLILLAVFSVIFLIYKKADIYSILQYPNFWWWSIIFSILFFSWFLKFFKKFHIQNIIRDTLSWIQEKLPFISGHDDINSFIKNEFYNELSIKNAYLDIKPNLNSELAKFFISNPNVKYFVNDFVFYQKFKHKISKINIQGQVSKDIQVAFPIFDAKATLIWILYLGKKMFSDAYTTQEINEINGFVLYLQSYLKYIFVYEKLEDISVNLDKKVDEKTIQYNTLISKQREYIAYIWHEIKNPITNSIFITDSVLDQLKDLNEIKVLDDTREDIWLLYWELVKVSDLVKRIFNTEQFDLEKTKLFKEEINMKDFLHKEISSFRTAWPDIIFEENIDNLGYKNIDITQFRQVIHNLLNNAVKFSSPNNKEIYISWVLQKNKIIVSIEDNWHGFLDSHIEEIFDKYTIWKWSMSWLWMWLYLCKKIMEYHWWSVSAKSSERFWWGCFIIEI